jgi:hypothetical protein
LDTIHGFKRGKRSEKALFPRLEDKQRGTRLIVYGLPIKAYAVASGAISILSVAGSRRGPNGQFVTICGRCRSQRDKPFFGFDKFKDAGYRRLEPSTEWKEAA